MDEYLKTLLEQIRCKQARSMVEEEIRGHMEEQIEENIAEGMDEIAAVEAAVEDMGNPVEVGISMDALHRPAMEKSMLILVGMISLLSIGIQIFIGRNYAELGQNWAVRHGVHILIGFLVMMLIYRYKNILPDKRKSMPKKLLIE